MRDTKTLRYLIKVPECRKFRRVLSQKPPFFRKTRKNGPTIRAPRKVLTAALTHPAISPEGHSLTKAPDVLPPLDPRHDRGLFLPGRAQRPAARDDGRGRAMGRDPGALPVRAAL